MIVTTFDAHYICCLVSFHQLFKYLFYALTITYVHHLQQMGQKSLHLISQVLDGSHRGDYTAESSIGIFHHFCDSAQVMQLHTMNWIRFCLFGFGAHRYREGNVLNESSNASDAPPHSLHVSSTSSSVLCSRAANFCQSRGPFFIRHVRFLSSLLLYSYLGTKRLCSALGRVSLFERRSSKRLIACKVASFQNHTTYFT